MHYFEKWTTRIYQNIKTMFVLWVFLYFPSFMHLLWNQTQMSFRNALRLRSPNHNFHSMFRLIHFSETRGRESRTILSGYFTMWTINLAAIWKKPWGVYYIPRTLFTMVISHPHATLFYGLPFTAWLLSSPSLEWGGTGRNRKNAYISLNTHSFFYSQ